MPCHASSDTIVPEVRRRRYDSSIVGPSCGILTDIASMVEKDIHIVTGSGCIPAARQSRGLTMVHASCGLSLLDEAVRPG